MSPRRVTALHVGRTRTDPARTSRTDFSHPTPSTPPPLVPQRYSQETVEQETEGQETGPIDTFDGSSHRDDDQGREALRRIIADFSRELGDVAHEKANLTRAVRLWQRSGLPRAAFYDLLYEARRLTRLYQGKQPPGRRIEATGAYFFAVLTQLLNARGLNGSARDPPATPPADDASDDDAATTMGGPP